MKVSEIFCFTVTEGCDMIIQMTRNLRRQLMDINILPALQGFRNGAGGVCAKYLEQKESHLIKGASSALKPEEWRNI